MALVGSWMMVTMIVVMGYSSTLVSLLAARNIPQPIQSLSDLVQSDNVVILKPNSGSTTYVLVSCSVSVYVHDLFISEYDFFNK